MKMTKEIFLITTIISQFILLSFDLLDKYFSNKNTKRNEKFKLRSMLFLVFVIIVYGIIQYFGLWLIPTTERLISYSQEFTTIFSSSTQHVISNFGLFILGALIFYISGFWDYIIHRFMSHSRALFFTHEYHHLPNELFLALPGISVRPFVAIAVLPATIGTVLTMFAGLSIFGYSHIEIIPIMYIVIFIQTLILASTHSSFLIKQKFIHKILKLSTITTPQEHELHHAVDIDGNYGNFTIIWDKIFGTYVDPTKPENQNHKIGLAYDQDFLGAITAGKYKISKKFRDYFQIDWYCNTN